ncbi:hypothetical protein KTD31_02075 [Burkholderia multivorans]|jgi:hypothetical protein|uniref:hypothetical protein n=1 Tax=Burkholderia multivorans TaxID=87883 RepID=UPI001C22EDF4|nr:hypothetical protein [Burkholderia multivorans]MBU9200192.1 hypothetical protein [Burkholderia multivorans]
MYRIRNNGEYATVCVSDWTVEAVGASHRTSYGGEILVHSSFGSFCHAWTNCAIPFKAFLLNISFESFMVKSLGNAFEQFDGLASVENVKRAILESRREEGLSAEDARDKWDELALVGDAARSCEYAFHQVLDEICTEDTIGTTTEFVARNPSHQAKGFWRELWPHFCEVLIAELQPGVPAVEAA